MTSDSQQPCTCGHVREAHEHYRRGSDCGICGADACAAFSPAGERPAGERPAPADPAPAEARPHSA